MRRWGWEGKREEIRSKDIGSQMWRKKRGVFFLVFFLFFGLVGNISRTLDIATSLAPKDTVGAPGRGFFYMAFYGIIAYTK